MHLLQVDYGTAAISQRITQSRTVNVSGFTPSTTVPLTITVFNSVGTTPPYVSNFNLCEGTPEQVMNLIGQDIEATRVVLQWNQPAVTNGLIYGYAISQGNTGVSQYLCAPDLHMYIYIQDYWVLVRPLPDVVGTASPLTPSGLVSPLIPHSI